MGKNRGTDRQPIVSEPPGPIRTETPMRPATMSGTVALGEYGFVDWPATRRDVTIDATGERSVFLLPRQRGRGIRFPATLLGNGLGSAQIFSAMLVVGRAF